MLDRKTLEPALVNRSGARRMVMGVPALRVGDGEESHEFAELAVPLWPEHEVPMVGHQAIGDEARRQELASPLDYPLHRQIVRLILEELAASHGTVKNVVSQSARRNPQSSWHGQMLLHEVFLFKDTRPLRIGVAWSNAMA